MSRRTYYQAECSFCGNPKTINKWRAKNYTDHFCDDVCRESFLIEQREMYCRSMAECNACSNVKSVPNWKLAKNKTFYVCSKECKELFLKYFPDKKDWEILEALQEHEPITYTALSEILNIPDSTLKGRLDKLVNKELVMRFSDKTYGLLQDDTEQYLKELREKLYEGDSYYRGEDGFEAHTSEPQCEVHSEVRLLRV